MKDRAVVSTFDAVLALALLGVASAIFLQAVLAPASSDSGETIDDLERASRLVRVAPLSTVPEVTYRDASGLERVAQGESMLSLVHIMASLRPCNAPCDLAAMEAAVEGVLSSLAEPGLQAMILVEPQQGAPFSIPDVDPPSERFAFELAMPSGNARVFVWEA